jgi:hypothetical protein
MAKRHDAHPESTLTPRRRDVDRASVHRELLERRLEGGAPATPGAYARAIEQWRRLPGAVVSTQVADLEQTHALLAPTDVALPAPTSEAIHSDVTAADASPRER